jgi:hypothetical protein
MHMSIASEGGVAIVHVSHISHHSIRGIKVKVQGQKKGTFLPASVAGANTRRGTIDIRVGERGGPR